MSIIIYVKIRHNRWQPRTSRFAPMPGRRHYTIFMSKFIVIDGNAIIHRAYHAIPPLTTKEGLIVNAVYGFASMLLKVWRDIKPDFIAVTFDVAGGSTARNELFKEYKGKRVKADQALYDQIPLVHELVESFNIPIYEKKGYEADDVIGTIVSKIGNCIDTYIVTGDMDTLQLVSDNVKVYTLRKGINDIVIYDPAGVKARYGFGPEHMNDYKALRGDTSDNIPGVPGIGEKTATELIQKIGGFEEIYKQLTNNKEQLTKILKPGVIKKLEAGEESGRMSKQLATLDCNVPDLNFSLDNCQVKPVNKEKVLELFQKWEFVSLLKRVPGFEGEEIGNKKQEIGNTKKKKEKSQLKYSEVKSKSECTDLLKLVKEKKQFACKILTSGTDIFTSAITGLVMAVETNGYYVPAKFFDEVKEVFSLADVELVGHDLKQLVKAWAVGQTSPSLSFVKERETVPLASAEERVGGEVSLSLHNPLFDIMIASYLLNPGNRANDIYSIILKVLGKELPSASAQGSLFGVDPRLVANELYYILLAAEKLKIELAQANNLGLFEKIEMPLIPVLAEIELNGVAIDSAKLQELSSRVSNQIAKVSAAIYKYAGHEFNIASPLQLREVLFDELEIPVEGIKKGKTGLSTGAEQLEKMRGLHPIIEEIEIFRELSKLQNTYIDVLPTLVNKTTGRIHTSFNQAITATGRLSSSDPNLQNIPIRTDLGREVREAFIAEPGNILISADYSQIELRIVASLAQDKKMMEIFEKGLDIHQATAAAINNVPLEKVTKEMRRAAKEVNFGVLYGMGTHGLSWRAEISYGEAKAFIEKYFREFSGVKKYLDQTIEFTKKEGYCETLFGRRRYIPELNSTNYQLRAAAERMAVNHPIQGTAADLMKMGMIAVSERIKNEELRMKNNAKMILQVHDELVFEVKNGLEKEVGQLVKETLENVAKLRVPIEVHVSAGKSWGKMEKVKM